MPQPCVRRLLGGEELPHIAPEVRTEHRVTLALIQREAGVRDAVRCLPEQLRRVERVLGSARHDFGSYDFGEAIRTQKFPKLVHDLRLHLKMLLIEFLGQLSNPGISETTLVAEKWGETWYRSRILATVPGSPGWFDWLADDQLSLTPHYLENSERTYLNTASAIVQVGNQRIEGVHRSFSNVERGELLAMVGSSGYLEIAANHGNAAAQLGVTLGDRVVLRIE